MEKKITIQFVSHQCSAEVESGTTILAAARQAGLVLESPCNGGGTCGKCKVKVRKEHLPQITRGEGKHHLSQEEEAEGWVLACQAKALGNIDVITTLEDQKEKNLKILDQGTSISYSIENHVQKQYDGTKTKVLFDAEVIGEEEGDTSSENYGVVIDIGTTTLVASLIRVTTGEELASVSALNPQSVYAQDVLTRIHFASNEEGLKTMHQLIVKEINQMLDKICTQAGIEKRFIYEIIYSGNTTMLHLAVGQNPESLGQYPYISQIAGGEYVEASEQKIDISPFGKLYLPPVISAYVGPDITSGILASRLQDFKGTVLFIDIGTNGEMAIAQNGQLFATSTAAGPAFEGMNITFGMRAEAGAIEFFEIQEDGSIVIRTIMQQKPKGICGSGLFDIVGELVRVGIIQQNGRFASSEKKVQYPKLLSRIEEYNGKPAFLLAEGVYLTQKDIRQVQLAKGAVRAGVEALLKAQQVESSQIDSVEIAGSFGYHLQTKSLVNIGILPADFLDKITFVGNTSKSGGKAFLLHSPYRREMKELVERIGCVELSKMDGFDELFIRCLNF